MNKPSPMAIVSMACGIASVAFCWAGFLAFISAGWLVFAFMALASGIVALIMSGKGENGARTSSVFCRVGKITGLIGIIVGGVAITVGIILMATGAGYRRYYW